MRREESSANPDKEPGHDDANADPGNGASGPGEHGYGGETNVGDDAGADVPEGTDPAARYLGDKVTPDPHIQSDG